MGARAEFCFTSRPCSRPCAIYFLLEQIVVHSLSHIRLFAIPWTRAHQLPLSFIISPSLLRLMSIELVMPSNHLLLCCRLLLPSIFPRIKVFSMSWLFLSGGQSIGVSASASVLSMNIQGLISFRIEWFDFLAVQGTLESSSASQFEGINSSALSLMIQFSHLYVTTGKAIALTRWTFAGWVGR